MFPFVFIPFPQGISMKNTTRYAFVSLLSLALGACTTDPVTGQTKLNKAGTGALIGAASCGIIGGVTHGSKGARNAALGCAAAGAGIGAYMDYQEKILREKTAGTGVKVERVGDQLKLILPEGITFASNSAVLNSNASTVLNNVAKVLADYPETKIQIAGHADSTGNAANNNRLSEQRAQSVSAHLASQNVRSARLSSMGYGSSQPVASNATPEGRAQNRRVEINITPTAQ
jgi:outer membrane protein OmpA-like peptidoglycan-associated protein